jgi:hypothetical protein
MSVLTAAPYSLPQGHVPKVRVFAANYYGDGAVSAANTAGGDVRVAPTAMGSPRRGGETSVTQIEVEWDALAPPDTGGSPITSYQLLWDAGSGAAPSTPLVGLVSDYTSTSYVVSVPGAPGSVYRFQLLAKNVYGWGAASPVVALAASDVPAQPLVATTEVQGTDARISWTAPSNNGASITSYIVEIRQNDGTYSEETVHCDGAVLVSAFQCDVPLSTLRAAPYNLVLGDLV